MVRICGTSFQLLNTLICLHTHLQVKSVAQDQKSRLVSNSLPALPFVVTSLAGKPDVVGSAAARRKDPILRKLRGRSTDHAPLAYYPEGTDLSIPGSEKLLFYLPAIGYVCNDCYSTIDH